MIFGTDPPKAIEQFNHYSIDCPTDSNDGNCKKSHGWGWIPKKRVLDHKRSRTHVGFLFTRKTVVFWKKRYYISVSNDVLLANWFKILLLLVEIWWFL